jgi:ADP-heptose:LPS heptosyltransferase
MRVKKILLVRWGGLGDLIVTLPAIRLLRSGFPSATLTLVGRREYGSFLVQAGVIDEAVSGDDPRVLALFSGDGSAGDDGLAWLAEFDLVVTWLNRARGGLPGAGRERIEGERKWLTICYDASGREAISVFFYRKTLEAMGRDLPTRTDFDAFAKLPLSSIPDDPAPTFARRPGRPRPLAVVHPGTGGEKKRWPLENFLEIARRLRARGTDGVFVTGEAEAALERDVDEAARSLGWIWLRSPSLAVLARLLGDADLYLGNDSGVTHLAAACGARVLALFRNDLIDIWRPFGDAHLLSADSVDEIRIDSVWSMAADLLCK